MSEDDTRVLVDMGAALAPKTHSMVAPSLVVGITAYQNTVFVACERGVYELKNGVLVPLQFVLGEQLYPTDLGRPKSSLAEPPHRAQHAVKP